MSPAPFVMQPGTVRVRHIKQVASGTPGAIQVLNAWYLPQPEDGLNGEPSGFVRGSYDLRLNEESTFTLVVPNDVGGDGVLHRDRFLIVTEKKAYRPGREWFEIYLDNELLFIGTPDSATITHSAIEIAGFDCLELLKKARETQAGIWIGAPRDLFEYYAGLMVPAVSEPFDQAPAGWSIINGATVSGGQLNLPSTGNAQAGSPAIINADTRSPWKVDLQIDLKLNGPVGGTFYVQLHESGPYRRMLDVSIYGDGRVSVGRRDSTGIASTNGVRRPNASNNRTTLIIEHRGRWTFVYLDGDLVVVQPGPVGGFPKPLHLTANTSSTDTTDIVRVSSLMVREHRGFLLRGPDKGDYRLPGAPTPGGLVGEYFDDADLRTRYDVDHLLSPLKRPYARRLDPQINFASGFLPAGTTGDYVSARWTGSIKLDGNPSEYVFALVDLDDHGRLWIGKTRLGEQIINQWPSSAVATHYGRQTGCDNGAGWYPIIIEWAEQGGGEAIRLQMSRNGGAYVDPEPSRLSPLGIYQAHVRADSHYEQIKAIARDFGYQFRVDPRQLESGEFPGQIIPRVRVGRDTDYTLDDEEARDTQVRINAADTVDSLLVDGQGTGAADQSQLTVQMTNYAGLIDQLIVHEDYESTPEIGVPELMLQRLTSLLALRSSPLEELQAHPAGQRELRDTFPLSGAMALFRWLPGDGLRVSLPKLTVEDLTTRQLMSVSRPFVPGGLGAPSVGFRARPRGLRETLRQLTRQVMQRDRNYQGTTTVVTGTAASNPPIASIPTEWSRVPLPANLDDIIAATFVVGYKTDASVVNIDIHTGTSAARTFAAPGRYDLTPYVRQRTDGVGIGPMMLARASGGTGASEYHVELLVRT